MGESEAAERCGKKYVQIKNLFFQVKVGDEKEEVEEAKEEKVEVAEVKMETEEAKEQSKESIEDLLKCQVQCYLSTFFCVGYKVSYSFPKAKTPSP